MYHLIIENGTREGESVQPKGGVLTIGRDPGNLLRLVDDGISGRHCSLRITRRGVMVRDCGSTNGVYINGKAISKETRLPSGCLLEVGAVSLRFEFLHNVNSKKLRRTGFFWLAVLMVGLTFAIQLTGIGLAIWTREHQFTLEEAAVILKRFPLPPDLSGVPQSTSTKSAVVPAAAVQPGP